MTGPVRVLIVDDSAYMRVVLRDMLQSEEGMSVVGTAKDGLEAVSKVASLRPDVVLLDIQMPKMDGLATLQRIMKESPTRVVMLSAMNKVDVQLPLRALEMGAVDFIPKPSGPVSIDIVRFKKAIADLVRSAASAQLDVVKRMRGPIHVKHLDEAKAREALKAAEEARRNASSDLEIAKVEAEMSSIAAQLAAIRKLRGR